MAEMRSFDRRRRLADALLQQSMTPGQGGQMVGRYYVGSGISDGLAKLGQALMARHAYGKADEEESAFKLGEQQKQQAAMDEFTTAISPREELDFSSIDNVLNQSGGLGYKTVKPTSRDLGMALLKARSAGLDVDKDAASLMMGETAPVEALGVVQQDQDGNVWNLNKRGQWNAAPFKAREKTDYEPMRLSIEQKRLEAQLEQMRSTRERNAQKDSRKFAAEDAGASAPLSAIDRIIEIGSDKNGFYTGTVGDKATYASLGLGVGKTDAKFDNSRALDQLETSLLLASKPPGMGAMSDAEWEMLKKGIPVRANFPSAQSYLSAVRNYRSTLASRINAMRAAQQGDEQDGSDVDANNFFGN